MRNCIRGLRIIMNVAILKYRNKNNAITHLATIALLRIMFLTLSLQTQRFIEF